MEIRYLNTDLDIESQEDLTTLIEAFGDEVFVLHHGLIKGMHHASFEFSHDHSSVPDEVIRRYCDLIEALPPTAKMIWNQCSTRLIDIGVESGSSPNCYRFEVHPSTLDRVSAIGASLAGSIYAMQTEDECGSITPGKKANLIFLKPIPSIAYLPYSFGSNLVDRVMINGTFVS